MNPIKIKLASTESELIEIKNLQRINLKGNLSESEKKKVRVFLQLNIHYLF